MRVLVTGGAGFIGSHLVDSLLLDGTDEVLVLDNLSSGNIGNLIRWRHEPRLKLIQGDLKNEDDVRKGLHGVDLVYHFAANPEVRVGETEPSVHFNENLVATFRLLEGMRKSGKAKVAIFASTSTVYGEPEALPTPEDYGPSIPISTYGASKLGCEALISSYAYTFGIRGLLLRFANIVGSRQKIGVLVDFIEKLKRDSKRLEILGNGSQKKSYLHVGDCVSAVRKTTEVFLKSESKVDAYNIGSSDQVSVGRIAEIVAEEMKLADIRFDFTGGVDGGRGWLGDVKVMELSVEKLLRLGWKPKFDGEDALRLATRDILRDMGA